MADLIPPGVNRAGVEGGEAAQTEREQARRRLERKAKFRADAAAYVLVNLFLVGLWAFTDRGYFWPGWVMAGWGVFLLLDAWNVYLRRPITEADVERELRRTR